LWLDGKDPNGSYVRNDDSTYEEGKITGADRENIRVEGIEVWGLGQEFALAGENALIRKSTVVNRSSTTRPSEKTVEVPGLNIKGLKFEKTLEFLNTRIAELANDKSRGSLPRKSNPAKTSQYSEFANQLSGREFGTDQSGFEERPPEREKRSAMPKFQNPNVEVDDNIGYQPEGKISPLKRENDVHETPFSSNERNSAYGNSGSNPFGLSDLAMSQSYKPQSRS